jgi:16S rRNA (uracil1498-N3)-methyltransferase
MNLVLLFPEDFDGPETVRLTGRRLGHIRDVHRARPGDLLTIGLAGGLLGKGELTHVDAESVSMRVRLENEPPPALSLRLVLALPRPKVLNRVIAAASSLGIKHVVLVNAWRVEKSYWRSPRLDPDNLREQAILGLEQSRDTILPTIELRRLFRPFVEGELEEFSRGSLRIVGHPGAVQECPRAVRDPVTLVIGPEGGFITEEIASLERAGFTPVSLGPRILRVETALAAIVGRMF